MALTKVTRNLSLRSIVSKTANYTATIYDDVILCDTSSGAFTITLPPAANMTGGEITIIKTTADGNKVTIDGDSSETINGATTKPIKTLSFVTVMSTGSAWLMTGDNRPRGYGALLGNNGSIITVSSQSASFIASGTRSGTGTGSLTFTTNFFANTPVLIPGENISVDGSTMRKTHLFNPATTGCSFITNEDLNDTRNYKDMGFTVYVIDLDL